MDKTQKRFLNEGAPKRTYPLPFHSMVGEALELAHPGCKVHFCMDEQEVLLHGLQQVFARTRELPAVSEELRKKIGDLSSGKSDEHEGIQAADLLAYLWNGYFHHGRPRGERGQALVFLLRRFKRDFGIIRPARLRATFSKSLEPDDIKNLTAMIHPPGKKGSK